jgi:hypothetical protein
MENTLIPAASGHFGLLIGDNKYDSTSTQK